MGMSCVSGSLPQFDGCRWYGNSLGLYFGLQCGLYDRPKAVWHLDITKYRKLDQL